MRSFALVVSLTALPDAAHAVDPCTQYTACRPLTTGEKALARSFFGPSLWLDHIRVIQGPQKGLGNIIGGRSDYAQVPRPGIIASYGNFHSPDYSRDKDRALIPAFMHELVHERQIQRGEFFKIGTTALIKLFRPGSIYTYSLMSTKRFESLNSEQQGAMVEEYFSLHQNFATGRRAFLYAADIPNGCKRLEKISAILGKHFIVQQTPPPLCR